MCIAISKMSTLYVKKFSPRLSSHKNKNRKIKKKMYVEQTPWKYGKFITSDESQIAILGLIKVYFNLSYVWKLKLDTFYSPSKSNIRTEVI